MVNGWVVTKGLGVYGTDYMKRAVVAAFGWPANLQDDAVYPYTEVDSNGEKLTGANKYTLTFAKGQTPPVNGFWSITMYEIDQGWWFVPNPLNKFTVSPRNNLKSNADGSLTLYFQNESPGKDKEANWLPAPKGEFIPMLRMYWPKDDPIDPRRHLEAAQGTEGRLWPVDLRSKRPAGYRSRVLRFADFFVSAL